MPIDWPDTWPEVLLYPLPDHVADKICAMYELRERQGGRLVPSTRFRDLGDLILISQQESLNGRTVHLALLSEVPRRNAIPHVVLTLPKAFEIPDPESSGATPPLVAVSTCGSAGDVTAPGWVRLTRSAGSGSALLAGVARAGWLRWMLSRNA